MERNKHPPPKIVEASLTWKDPPRVWRHYVSHKSNHRVYEASKLKHLCCLEFSIISGNSTKSKKNQKFRAASASWFLKKVVKKLGFEQKSLFFVFFMIFAADLVRNLGFSKKVKILLAGVVWRQRPKNLQNSSILMRNTLEDLVFCFFIFFYDARFSSQSWFIFMIFPVFSTFLRIRDLYEPWLDSLKNVVKRCQHKICLVPRPIGGQKPITLLDLPAFWLSEPLRSISLPGGHPPSAKSDAKGDLGVFWLSL